MLVAIPVTAFIYRAIVAAEENYLRGKFGPAFDGYCRSVPRFLPKLSGIGETFASMQFRWRRVLVKEYGTPVAWILVLVRHRRLQAVAGRQLALHAGMAHALPEIAAAAALAWLFVRFLKKVAPRHRRLSVAAVMSFFSRAQLAGRDGPVISFSISLIKDDETWRPVW